MRLLLISIEFNAGTFSGNGVYACSQARALTQLGHEVLVIAGAPPGHAANVAASAAGSTSGQLAAGAAAPALAQRIIHVELPAWGRLDADCAWQAFADGAGGPDVRSAAAAFRPAAVLGVDWHSVGAYDALAEALPGQPPFVFLNYRVYHRTASPAELKLIEDREARALRLSRCSLVLSRADADYLRRHFPEETSAEGGEAPLHVLLPALRADMHVLPPPADMLLGGACQGQAAGGPGGETSAGLAGGVQQQGQQLQGRHQQHSAAPPAGAPRRRYLACCVRLSPEKEPHRFVDALLELQRKGILERLGVTPLMAGAGWDSEYGREQRRRLEAGVPQCVVHDTFLGPSDLAAIYASTLLNAHPPTYDAYGMTVVEAASQGAPSLVQGGGHVGATDLLDAAAGEVLVCEMDQPAAELADRLEQLLLDRARLAAVGRSALAKARSWGEHDNAAALISHVRHALAAGQEAAK